MVTDSDSDGEPGGWSATWPWEIRDANGTVIANLTEVDSKVKLPDGERDANARLIAEAPAMREALAMYYARDISDGVHLCPCEPCVKTRSILARVGGGT